MEFKKYKKMYFINVPIYLKVAIIATIVAFSLSGISFIITNTLYYVPLFILLDVPFWIIVLFAYLGDLPCIIFDNEKLKYRNIFIFKNINYDSIKSVCISNALIHRIGFDTLARKVQYTENGIVKSKNIPGAWVTLLNNENIENRLYPFMAGSNVESALRPYFLYDFQFRKNVFLELLSKYNGKIYILEEVFERFYDELEYVFLEKNVDKDRVIIIPKNKIWPEGYNQELPKVIRRELRRKGIES